MENECKGGVSLLHLTDTEVQWTFSSIVPEQMFNEFMLENKHYSGLKSVLTWFFYNMNPNHLCENCATAPKCTLRGNEYNPDSEKKLLLCKTSIKTECSHLQAKLC